MALELSTSGKTCLVATGDAQLRQLITTSLQQIGLSEVAKATSIEEASEAFSQSTYDLVICGEIDIDALARLVRGFRRDAPWGAAEVPLICLTSRVDSSRFSELLECKPNCVMTLPINLRSMLKNVDRALNGQGPRNKAPRSGRHHIGGPVHEPAAPLGGLSDGPDSAPRHDRVSPSTGGAANSKDDGVSGRDATILNGVNLIAATIDRLRQAMTAADDAPTRSLIREQLAEAAQRLVNLLSLENLEDGQHGRLQNYLRHKLDVVRAAFFDILTDIAVSRLAMATVDIDEYIRRKEIIVGHASAFADRLAVVEEIFSVMGATRGPDAGVRQTLATAWGEVARIQDAEVATIQLAEFSDKKQARRPLARSEFAAEGEELVGSQSAVMTSLKTKAERRSK